MALYKWSIRLAGIGSFPDQIQYMSQDDYNALSEEAKMNGTTYGIIGAGEGPEPEPNLLKFEFVEKLTLSGSSDNWQYIGKIYDYPVYIIATAWNTWFNEPQGFVVATWPSSSNNSYPSAWSYSEQYGIAHGYAYPGSKIYMVKSWWAQAMIYNIYVYKVNLPEDE